MLLHDFQLVYGIESGNGLSKQEVACRICGSWQTAILVSSGYHCAAALYNRSVQTVTLSYARDLHHYWNIQILMNTRVLFVVVFIAGVSTGWLGKTWHGPVQSDLAALVAGDSSNANTHVDNLSPTSTAESISTDSVRASNSHTNGARVASQNAGDVYLQSEQQQFEENSQSSSVFSLFQKLLNDRFYYDAMAVYQEQVQQNGKIANELRRVLLDELKILADSKNNNDFSELIESYLSVYYDDIEVLFLLADFNQMNGSYLEVVDVYLLANTYAYTDIDQDNLRTRFDRFVKEIDGLYTNQKNWVSLINLYLHIGSSGLMTSPYQYRQALAHLRSGDEYFAIEQFEQLLNDSLVGESAAIELNRLTGITEETASASNSVWDTSESVPLQKLGNQYLANLTVNRSDAIKLLIDTGASMTTLTRTSFDSLNTSGEAVEIEKRVFRTASGVIMGTVYSVPELSLGPYLMRNTRIAVIDSVMSQGIDGLLGMNVLGQFRFQIDQENARLLLSGE